MRKDKIARTIKLSGKNIPSLQWQTLRNRYQKQTKKTFGIQLKTALFLGGIIV